METLGYAILAMFAAGLGTIGGLGGAILLVPALVVTGTPAAEAAPIGLVTVVAGSISAAPRQLVERATNHRVGVATELAASTGAVVGATLAGTVSDRLLTYVLAAVAATAAAISAKPPRHATVPDPRCVAADIGERIGALAGATPTATGIVPYTARRVPITMGLMWVAGLIAGTSGVSGGFIKTPATSEVMRIPTRVAASTTTFTVGITSSTALLVLAIDGRIDARSCAAAISGSLVGGRLGSTLQSSLSDDAVRAVLCVLLAVVAVILVARA